MYNYTEIALEAYHSKSHEIHRSTARRKKFNTDCVLFVYSLSHWAAKEPAKHKFMAGNTDHWAKMKHKVGSLEILTVNWRYFFVFISKRSNRAFERLSDSFNWQWLPCEGFLPEFNIHEGRLGITKGNGQKTLRKWQ